MASRRDLYQSYQFLLQRTVSGLVQRETDPAVTPMRRMGGAVFGSVMVAVIALAIAGIIGVVSPGGNTTWKDAGKVIVEKETGARFAWLQNPKDKRYYLHPVTNLASAALLVGTTETISVSRSSLADAPRGAKLGIADAPDALPAPADLLTGPWTLCSTPAVTDSGEQIPSTALSVGAERASGTSIGDGAIVARDVETGALQLIWNDHRYLITAEDAVLEGLGLRGVPQIEVGTAILTAFPDGGAIGPLTPPNSGAPSTAIPGGSVGQILSVQSATGTQYYLVLADRLKAISQVDAVITLADPGLSAAYGGAPPTEISSTPAVVNAAPREDLADPKFSDPPRDVPKPAQVQSKTSTICAGFASGQSDIDIAVEAQVEGAELAPATPRRESGGTVLADRVLVPGGKGALVRSLLSPSANEGPLYLVTDEGKKWAIPGEESLRALGLGGTKPIDMPASLVARIPEGTALDRRTAMIA